MAYKQIDWSKLDTVIRVYLYQKKKMITTKYIEEKFGVSRETVEKRINEIREEENKIIDLLP